MNSIDDGNFVNTTDEGISRLMALFTMSDALFTYLPVCATDTICLYHSLFSGFNNRASCSNSMPLQSL